MAAPSRSARVTAWSSALVLALVLALGGCDAKGDRPGVIVLQGMHQSIPYDAYDAHPDIGQALRKPPEGTVIYGSPARDERPPEDRARARKLYATYCNICHGPQGQGDGPIIGRFPNPPSLTGGNCREMSDDQLWDVITNGQGLMAAYDKQVHYTDRWHLVRFIRELQK